MKGLLLKDFYNLSRMIKQYLLILAAMGVWAFFMKNAAFISMYIALCSAMLVLSSFSYDEYARFDIYAMTMPIDRKTLVQEKYVLLLLAVGGGTAVGIPVGGLFGLAFHADFAETAVSSLAVGCLFLIVYSFVFPYIFKWGVEKARMIMVGSYLIIFLLFIGVLKLAGISGVRLSEMDFLDWLIPTAMTVLAVVVMGASYVISLKIVEKKEW